LGTPGTPGSSGGATGAGARGTETRQVFWPGTGSALTRIFQAADLAGHAGQIAGPAVIEGADTTHVIPPGWTFRIDEYGNARLHGDEKERA
jgi:N-methylhydantoinase A/oxoprolinase/acetone carboxylase beta subunit